MRAILDRLLRGFVVWGTLEIRWPDGTMSRYAGAEGPRAGMALRDQATVRRVTLNPGSPSARPTCTARWCRSTVRSTSCSTC